MVIPAVSHAARISAARRLFLAATLIALGGAIPAQQPLSLADAALRGQTIFAQSAVTGMVLVVVRGNEVVIEGYGETAPGSGRIPDSNSEVRLCSISKVFAGDLLTRLSAAGTVSLSDPLQRYAPRHVSVPQGVDRRPITLEDLALHTSGLPREVLPSPAKAPHFTFPSYAARWTWLPRQKLITSPGAAALYSNVGFDLLGDALASASGESYAQFLHSTLLQPLEMWDTTLVPSKDQCARLLQPVKDEGPCTETLASGASGGVYSTGADTAKLLKYLLHLPGSVPHPAAALSVYLNPAQLKSVQGLSHAGDPTGIGLGWVQLGDPATPSALLEKTGGGAGFTTYIALSPSRQTGIFLAATWGKGDAQIDLFQEANNLLAALANVPPLPPRVRPAPIVRRHAKPRRRTRKVPSTPH
jgi:D-alanyl-D-alanine-carboxypeptidase/D-alanyl-D-alanine-endopeptidase